MITLEGFSSRTFDEKTSETALINFNFLNAMGKYIISKKHFTSISFITLLLLAFMNSWGQTTIFSENMGSPSANTLITANTFQNGSPITFTGSGDVRTSTPSSTYPGFSASGNVFLTTGGTKDFQIAGINNSACSSSTLTFGVFKSTTASTGSELAITVSTDGISYTALPTLSLTAGSGTAVWSLVTITSGIPSASNLRIRFLNTSATTVQFRIDDVKLVGACSTSHTVTFNANGGAGSMSAQTASVSTNLTSNAFTKSGCTFTGWNTAANGTGTAYTNSQAYSFAADLTLYAQWNCSHTVTFNANGGSGLMAVQTASVSTNLTSNAFTKSGCTFTGWNTAADGTGTAYTNSQAYSFAADLTLYAQWNCSHTVTFNANGGSGSMAVQTASVSTNLTSNGFTQSGCTFTSWNTAANGTGTSYTNAQAYSFAADLTLYAQWNCPHTVTFNANGGSGSMTAQIASSTTNLTSNGFTNGVCIFTGWNTAVNGSGTSYTDAQSYSFAADLTLYAQWNCSGASHTVTFNANGGSGSMASQTGSVTTNLTSNGFSQSGCSFTGWNTLANGSGTAYTDAQAYSFAADITLYAQWNCSHTVTFNGNGGSGSMASQTGSVTTNLTSNGFTNSNSNGACTFTGWNTAVNGSGSSYGNNASYAFTADLTLYAQWNCPAGSGTVCIANGAMGTGYTFGCGDNIGPCNLNSTYSAYGTFCSGSATVACGSGCSTTNVSTTFNLESTCTATITAEFKARASGCSNSAMDGSDKISITNSGGTVSAQSSTMTVSNGTCTLYSSLGTYTTSTANLAAGCNNANGTVKMIITGGSASIGGTMNRGDEIITYSITTSGTCSMCAIPLPVELVDYFVVENEDKNYVIWKVMMEENIEKYIIERSDDGINFSYLGSIYVKNTETIGVKNYSFSDPSPNKAITYYRLSAIENSGVFKVYSPVYIDRLQTDHWVYNYYQNENDLVIEFKKSVPKNATIALYDLSGQLVTENKITSSQTEINIAIIAPGIYFAKIETPYKTENFKIVIQN